MNIKKILYIIFGCISFGLGAVGAVLPVLPTFPFLIFAAFCFARSSKKLDKWFKGTKLYKNNLETYAKGQGMTRKTKVRIMITVTFLMSFGFFIMFRKNLYIPCSILFGVWLFHILYFTFGEKDIFRRRMKGYEKDFKYTFVSYIYFDIACADHRGTYS